MVKVIIGLGGVGAVAGVLAYSYKKHIEKKERSYIVQEIRVNPADEYDEIFDEDIFEEDDSEEDTTDK